VKAFANRLNDERIDSYVRDVYMAAVSHENIILETSQHLRARLEGQKRKTAHWLQITMNHTK
jgi:hypothetical protein